MTNKKDWLDSQADEIDEAFAKELSMLDQSDIERLTGTRHMRTEIINTLAKHFEAHILKHKMNVDIMLANPRGIHDHTDYMDAVEKELAQIAEYMDKLEVLEKYF